MRSIVVLSVLLVGAVASATLAETAAPPAKDGTAGELCVRGRLTGEGAECLTLRAADGTLYSLARSTAGLARDGEICVCGRKAEVSICQQGIALTAVRIGGAGDCH